MGFFDPSANYDINYSTSICPFESGQCGKEGKKAMTMKPYQKMEYQIKSIFVKNHTENMQQKLVPDLFIILVNNPKQPLHAKNYFQKTLKKVTSFFLSNPVPFNRQNYQK